jgi:alpha-2-macroglobulin
MRKKILLFFLTTSYISTFCQQNLSNSRQTSTHTYIYRITTAEAKSLFRSGMDDFGEKHLHSPIDSFLHSTEDAPILKTGNYIFIRAEGNRLIGDLSTVDDLQYKVISNNRDFMVALHNKSGQLISGASVFINNRKLLFDQQLQVYRLNKRKRNGIVRIYHDGILHQFGVQKGKKYRGTVWQRLSNSFPLRYVVQPVKRWITKRDQYRNYDYHYIKTAYEKRFSGFMIFNKPIYKPGDTVKIKAYIFNKRKQAINRPLLLRLTERDFAVDSVIAKIKPYRPGAYEYQFAITDSLDLTLDTDYLLTLEELSSSKYNLDLYEGDLDDDEYALRRKILMRGKFEYEEYELAAINFKARSDKEENHLGDPVSVYLKATDENDLPVMDGRVELSVTPSTYGAKEFHQAAVFLLDTIWRYTQILEQSGETKITLPDSIFPAASFPYTIECVFLNSNNERHSQRLSQHYFHNPYKIVIDQKDDSLFVRQLHRNKTDIVKATIVAFNENDDTLGIQKLFLPTVIKINPFARTYEVETDTAFEEYILRQKQAMVYCQAIRTRDSVFIASQNPQRLFFWYTIFAGNKVIQRGYTDRLEYREKSRTKRNYFVSLQYIYGDKPYTENFTVVYQDKLLNIWAEQPTRVYPGQTTDLSLRVTNAWGKPVADADVTAYAVTKKFRNSRVPFIPYLGKIYPRRKTYGTLYPKTEENEEKQGSIFLNWQRWSREMGLDSIEYFRFLHPTDIYRNTEFARDSVTQIAPFVTIKGSIEPVHQLYIDEIPVYFSQSQQLLRYSFSVSPGKHALRLRTHNRMIRVDSIWATAGVKTFFSINADIVSNKLIRVERMPDSLTNYEKNFWSKYLILVENTFGENFSYVAQRDFVSLLNYRSTSNLPSNRNILAGPFPDQPATLVVKNKFEQPFEPEGNYLFNINKGLVKQKQLPGKVYPFNSALRAIGETINFKDMVLTEKEIDSLWAEYLNTRNTNEDLFRNELLNKKGNGSLIIGIDKNSDETSPLIKNVFLFRYDDPDFIRIYKGAARDLGFLPIGIYRLFLLLKNDAYFIKDSLLIKPDGLNYYSTGIVKPSTKDNLSISIAGIVNSRELYQKNQYQEDDFNNIRELVNQQLMDQTSFTRAIVGRVVGLMDNAPIVGATVSIKGTKVATTTDLQGYFYLKTPRHGSLIVSAVGYERLEKRMGEDTNFEFKLRAGSKHLNEVVVTGYGITQKKALSYSVSADKNSSDLILGGRAAGVNITMRGIRSENAYLKRIVILDGLSYTGDLSKLDTTKIASITILKNKEATALYGAMGENGVIIITTKQNTPFGITNPPDGFEMPGNTLRKNFRDDAFWQPRLRTNAEGRVSFKITYPDDITSWRSFFIAVAGKQTGFLEQQVKSFKLLSTSLVTPQFLITGDSTNVIGKVLNYTTDSTFAQRTFSIEKGESFKKQLALKNSWLDTFPIRAGETDSMRFSYSVEKSDGYLDGEERTIPVFNQEVLETTGFFSALENDTAFIYSLPAGDGKIKIYAEASLLPVLIDEIEHIRQYEYLCNEQLASKLKALLLKRKLYAFLKKDFKEEKNINDLISKLNQGRSAGGLWGWWNNNEIVPWISLHVVEALLEAEAGGYQSAVNKNMLIDYLMVNLESYRGTDKLTSLILLKRLGAKAEFKKYTDSLERKYTDMSLYEQLRLLRLKQQLGMTISIDTFVNKHRSTLFGNRYWGEDNYQLFDNAIQNTILMYQLMKKQGGHETSLQKIRSYFLEKRRDGKWRNTYESSLILETILPDLLYQDSLPRPASIVINGSAPVSVFPFSLELQGEEKIQVSKQGHLPVYFTAYQQNWKKNPEKISDGFSIKSYFEKDGEKKDWLKAGEPVLLKVNVVVKGDADYVMIEIPIPAGCSYKEKNQSYSNNEVHREYFKNKLSIFCKTLRPGEYVFTVSLLPRYTGTYQLNPAKAEMMYFPVFYGREAMKKITIR